MLNNAEQDWFLSECGKLPLVGESGKWNIINRLTNQSKDRGVCPIRKVVNGQSVYLFDDEDIRSEMENYQIHKMQDSRSSHLYTQTTDRASSDPPLNSTLYQAMNDDISDFEVKSPSERAQIHLVLIKRSDTPGPDDISAQMFDKADRDLMHHLLKLLWNKSWKTGTFIKEWKQENRVVIKKPGKDDYHECCAYRTISITSVLDKRLEHITSQRLIRVLNEIGFDTDQHAYLPGRSSTQAILTLVECIKSGLLKNQYAGAVFFDFTDAFSSIDRSHLM